jgi:Flp pilus assembly pilin Flp
MMERFMIHTQRAFSEDSLLVTTRDCFEGSNGAEIIEADLPGEMIGADRQSERSCENRQCKNIQSERRCNNRHSEKGAAMVEYAVLVALVLCMCVVSVSAIGDNSQIKFNEVKAAFANFGA